MLKRTGLLLVGLARDWLDGPLGVFAAKFDAPAASSVPALDVGAEHGEVEEGSLPNTPGIWRLTDEKGLRTSFRIMDQNGELYAKVRRLAIPVQNLPGKWTLVE